ncbi:MAG: peroxide stress protein YaaA [Microbacteriaceae bacterium]|nr:peroxide stress protein YaaA [Microbacteriaceae bacterium]
MHILLPPSETKRSGGGDVFSPTALHHDAVLGDARAHVRDALVSLSSDTEAAVRALKLGVKNRGEAARNLELDSSGAMPAIDRYTGVLYDALDTAALNGARRQWLAANVSIQSALFGLISASDEIPAYRLSASTRLPALGTPLKRVWSQAHASLDWSASGWILDLRSNDYVALAPAPPELVTTLHVVQRGDDGEVRALNHFNKAAKGDLVRRLASDRPSLDGPDALIGWANDHGLDMFSGPERGQLTLVTTLAPVGRASRWVKS